MTTVMTYASLRSAVRRMLREGDEAGAAKRVARYYGIGELIDTHVMGHGGRAEYGQDVIRRLADDLDVGNQRLYEMLNVRRAYRISRPAGKLSWTHYVALASLEDERLRAAYETRAIQGRWSRRQLRDRIKEGLLQGGNWEFLEDLNQSVPPTPRRGLPYTYRVKDASARRLLLDLGMGAEHVLEADEAAAYESGDVVRTKRDGGLYEVESGDGGNLYTFKATVIRVVDGDTFWARVDYGFRFYQPWKVRFRGVNAPELITHEGGAAKAWVEERLRDAPFVVMTTTKVGIYGRYIADVFYPPSPKPPPSPTGPRRTSRRTGDAHAAWGTEEVAAQGKYLNGEMVEAGIARRA